MDILQCVQDVWWGQGGGGKTRYRGKGIEERGKSIESFEGVVSVYFLCMMVVYRCHEAYDPLNLSTVHMKL